MDRFFALGVLIRKYRLDRKLLCVNWPLAICAALSAAALALMFAFGKWGYFSIFGMIFELSFAVVLLYVASALCRFHWAHYVARIGAYTYCIYLLHMPIVQAICTRLPNVWAFDMIKPLLGFVVMVCLVSLGKKLCSLLPFGDRICRLVGIRFR